MGFITAAVGRKRDRESNEAIAAQNLGFQQENLAYQKQLQQDLFAREDNAMQRKVADLKAAGLSPTLAAGGPGAGAGSPVVTQAPQNPMKYEDNPLSAAGSQLSNVLGKVNMAMGLLKMRNDIAISGAQKDLMSEKVKQEKFSNKIHERFGVPRDQTIPSDFIRKHGMLTVGGNAMKTIYDKLAPIKGKFPQTAKLLDNLTGRMGKVGKGVRLKIDTVLAKAPKKLTNTITKVINYPLTKKIKSAIAIKKLIELITD